MARNFWSENIQAVAEKSPLAVVSEAASQLAKITQGLVEANVRSGSDTMGRLVHRLYIQAPTLAYETRVASFSHQPVPLYPVLAAKVRLGAPMGNESEFAPATEAPSDQKGEVGETGPHAANLSDQAGLEEWLAALLGSKPITTLVNNLLATASAGAYPAVYEATY